MPELPEVQSVRASLAAHVIGQAVLSVEVRRAGIITGDASPAALLQGRSLTSIERHGKQLAIFGASSGGGVAAARCVCVHLGMTGSLRVIEPKADRVPADRHVHVVWHFDDGRRVEFRDPRRFGGIWTFPDAAALMMKRWRHLGPDALVVTAAHLGSRLKTSQRPIKAALLDQAVVAGLGNIYVDELLFLCRVHPQTVCHRLEATAVTDMVRRMRRLLNRAIQAGGSTLRDYVEANGRPGGFQHLHKVYGRADQPCLTCGTTLRAIQVGGRTTVFCPTCQPPPGRRKTSSV